MWKNRSSSLPVRAGAISPTGWVDRAGQIEHALSTSLWCFAATPYFKDIDSALGLEIVAHHTAHQLHLPLWETRSGQVRITIHGSMKEGVGGLGTFSI
ncbi:hypothetical protein VNO77_46375 [Canavalia gladiata]|uniref:Uncharacterized protein n=1 Tax=Canavalia gladiata TaxID=3824 RepID=A0AAN9JGP8_CANGL